MRITDRVQTPAARGQLSQRRQTGGGKISANPPLFAAKFQQAPLNYCLDGRWQLWLARLRAASPGAQQNTVSDERIAPEVLPEVTANEFSLGCCENGGGERRKIGHDLNVSQPLSIGMKNPDDTAAASVSHSDGTNWMFSPNPARGRHGRQPRRKSFWRDAAAFCQPHTQQLCRFWQYTPTQSGTRSLQHGEDRSGAGNMIIRRSRSRQTTMVALAIRSNPLPPSRHVSRSASRR